MPQHGTYHTPPVEFVGWLVWTLARPVRALCDRMGRWQDTCWSWLDTWQPGSAVFLGRRGVRLTRWPVPAVLGLAACAELAALAVRP